MPNFSIKTPPAEGEWDFETRQLGNRNSTSNVEEAEC